MDFNVGDVVYYEDYSDCPMTVSFLPGKTNFFGSIGKDFEKRIKKFGISNDIYCTCFDKKNIFVCSYKPQTLTILSCNIAHPELNIGDVVFLKSDPERLMIVSAVLRQKDEHTVKLFEREIQCFGFKDGDVQCTWFNWLKRKKHFFKAEMLVIV